MDDNRCKESFLILFLIKFDDEFSRTKVTSSRPANSDRKRTRKQLHGENQYTNQANWAVVSVKFGACAIQWRAYSSFPDGPHHHVFRYCGQVVIQLQLLIQHQQQQQLRRRRRRRYCFDGD